MGPCVETGSVPRRDGVWVDRAWQDPDVSSTHIESARGALAPGRFHRGAGGAVTVAVWNRNGAMTEAPPTYDWGNTAAYEAYIGRWSRLVAAAFLQWLALPSGQRWLDVGCGTGALTQTILATTDPAAILGVDPTAEFLAAAEAQIIDPRVRFATGEARALPVPDEAYDAVVAGLVLNFVPDPEAAVVEMARIARRGGTVAAYVWDFAGERQFQRYFWEAATALDPAAAPL